MTKKEVLELIEELTDGICGAVENCGCCAYCGDENNRCKFSEIVAEKVNKLED